MSDDTHTHGEFLDALLERLEALGWEIEYAPGGWPHGEIEVIYPDPKTGHAMRFSGWWISWRPVDGVVACGVGDDTMDRRWRATLDVDTTDPVAVANAADRAMHLLWHQEDADLREKLYAQEARHRAFRQDVETLANRIVVTPGMLRTVLKSERKSW
ncbi:hypothetical protein RVR_8300 [Actinacidiphila reveromycinica]|uniref:Immunity protein 63 domain-containing protein n=1 Tax=Actinacidiphila reveromycinica TaxID=659352 RepID=A0A7U3VRU8_9ACTN|nr:hypothetical protein [Streptomyces sp. SN-593]BBB01060.1 hypothetical protein RVR_8300 [Streptomyces sp. SN-593]